MCEFSFEIRWFDLREFLSALVDCPSDKKLVPLLKRVRSRSLREFVKISSKTDCVLNLPLGGCDLFLTNLSDLFPEAAMIFSRFAASPAGAKE
jgi:hypothetical protein